MARRYMNPYFGVLGLTEDFEQRQNIEDNFGDLFGQERNYASELLAAKGGVGYGQLYHTDGAVKVRYSLLPIPVVANLTLQGYAPIVRHTMFRQPAAGSLTFTGRTPSLNVTISPGSASLGITGAIPALT